MKKNYNKKRKEINKNNLELIELLKEFFPLIKAKWDQFNLEIFLKDFFKNNRKGKIVALVFASIFSFYVSLQDVSEMNISIPLRVEIPNDLTIVESPPEQISLFISGKQNDLANLDVKYIFAEIDIDSDDKGAQKYRPRIKGLSGEIQLNRFVPDEVPLTISKLDNKNILVEPQLFGKLANNYVIKNINISPRVIKISGPTEILADLTTLETEPIDITGLSQNKQITVSFSKSIHPSLKINTEQNFVVELIIGKETVERIIDSKILISKSTVSNSLAIAGDHYVTNVRLRMEKEVLGDFNPQNDVNFLFDTSQLRSAGSRVLRVESLASPGISVVSFGPRFFNVEVIEKIAIPNPETEDEDIRLEDTDALLEKEEENN